MQDIVRHDAPWVFGFHPKTFSLFHSWYQNLKPNLMANNRLKYTRIDPIARAEKRQAWNRPVVWPLLLAGLVITIALAFAVSAFRSRTRKPMQ
jgi:anti-sigma-K factor RskA